MFGKYNITALTALAIGAFALGSAASAQTPCNTQTVIPYGQDMRHVSRNTSGFASATPNSIVYFYKCPTTGVVTRYTYRQPFTMDITVTTGCDEAPNLMGKLSGYLYTETRMADPYPNAVKNVRIGWHYGSADVLDVNNKKIGSAKFEGTISTNSSRPPLPIIPNISGVPAPDCYECGHFTGEITITLTPLTATAVNTVVVKAFYQFEALYGATAQKLCDDADPCDIGFKFENGTLDGIMRRACPTTSG
ncbi:MAG TPA: hypothetical protein VGM37_16100 [Armatimonadota bacterium]